MTSVSASIQPPKTTTRSAVPALPVLPALPKDGAVDRSKPTVGQETVKEDDKPKAQTEAPEEPKQEEKPTLPAAPKSWAAIAKGRTVSKQTAQGQPELNGTATGDNASSEVIGSAASAKSSSASLAEALKSFEAGNSGPIHFIEPSGLKNTGTDCYMNSVSRSIRPSTAFGAQYSTLHAYTDISRRFCNCSFSAHRSTASWTKFAKMSFTVSSRRQKHL